MVDISIVDGIINQLIIGGAPPCMGLNIITSTHDAEAPFASAWFIN